MQVRLLILARRRTGLGAKDEAMIYALLPEVADQGRAFVNFCLGICKQDVEHES